MADANSTNMARVLTGAQNLMKPDSDLIMLLVLNLHLSSFFSIYERINIIVSKCHQSGCWILQSLPDSTFRNTLKLHLVKSIAQRLSKANMVTFLQNVLLTISACCMTPPSNTQAHRQHLVLLESTFLTLMLLLYRLRTENDVERGIA